MRVIVVEDNAMNSELARDLLELAGHEVQVAPDGAAFRALLDGPPPELIIMDLLLPDANGVALLGEARARWGAIPVVAVTAHAVAADRERLLGAGFDRVLTKPIDTRTFADEVTGVARGARG